MTVPAGYKPQLLNVGEYAVLRRAKNAISHHANFTKVDAGQIYLILSELDMLRIEQEKFNKKAELLRAENATMREVLTSSMQVDCKCQHCVSTREALGMTK